MGNLVNSIIFLVLDSARFDHLKSASVPHIKKIGKIEKRYSYASWTSPSHHTYLMGLLPHCSPKKVFASETYYSDLMSWGVRTGVKPFQFNSFLPEFCLPKVLKTLGYQTHAIVSLPVLNPHAGFSRFFDKYELMPKHDEFHKIVKKVKFGTDPSFYFLNLGESHYPYSFPGCSGARDLPRLHGLNGTIKHRSDLSQSVRFFAPRDMRRMKEMQISAIEYVDSIIGTLFNKAPSGTRVIITSDHGELFGEDGYFGHGPIFHEKAFEIPFVEGIL